MQTKFYEKNKILFMKFAIKKVGNIKLINMIYFYRFLLFMVKNKRKLIKINYI